MQISIKTNFPEVQLALDRLQTEVRDKALPRAINRTIEQAKTDMVRGITGEFNIRASKVREKLFIKRAGFRSGRLVIEAELSSQVKVDAGTETGRRSINLVNFGAKQTAKGVTVKIKKGGPRKLLRGLFIANQGRTVFRRQYGTVMTTRSRSKGKQHREKIQGAQVIGVPQMFNTKRINLAVVRKMREKFPAIVEREIAFYTRTFNRTSR